MPGRGHEAAAKLAEELKSNPSGPAGGGGAGSKLASNPLHPGLTQERLRAMEAEEEVRVWTWSAPPVLRFPILRVSRVTWYHFLETLNNDVSLVKHCS